MFKLQAPWLVELLELLSWNLRGQPRETNLDGGVLSAYICIHIEYMTYDLNDFPPDNWGRFPLWPLYFTNGLKPPTSGTPGTSACLPTLVSERAGRDCRHWDRCMVLFSYTNLPNKNQQALVGKYTIHIDPMRIYIYILPRVNPYLSSSWWSLRTTADDTLIFE